MRWRWPYTARCTPATELTQARGTVVRKLRFGVSRMLNVQLARGFTSWRERTLTLLAMRKGASYLVCNDPAWFEVHKESRWLSQQMTQLGTFRVFDLLNSDANLQPQNAETNQ